MDTQDALRKHYRFVRNRFAQRETANPALIERLLTLPSYQSAKAIAFYMAQDGEVDLEPAMQAALADGKHCYLPVMPKGQRTLGFARRAMDTPLRPNRYGVLEPPAENTLSPEALDLVFMPLVAFSMQRDRLGMGGGYYDRTFAFRRASFTPALVGVAFDCQCCPTLKPNAWDIPCDQIVTESTIL